MRFALISDEVSQDPYTAFELAAGWGIRTVELRQAYRFRLPSSPEWAWRRTASAVRDCGMTVSAISPGLFKPIMDVDGSTRPVTVDIPSEIRRHLDDLLPRALDFAALVGAQAMIVFALPRSGDDAAPPGIVTESLGVAAERASAGGVTLLLENGAGSWADSGAATARILDAVNSDNLKANWDPANVIYAGLSEDPVEQGYPAVAHRLAGVHVKDAAMVEGKPHWRMLGEGVVDWPRQIAALRSDGYDGLLTLEPHLQYESPVGLVEKIERFVKLARKLAAGDAA